MERPICYQGQEGYIFVSYAHKDAKKVWPIIARLQEDGFRVWYDDGIDPGSEWDENIAAHVADCGYFLAFLSDHYLDSNNCKDELNFSRDQGKPQLLIYLEDVELPQGMAMRLGRNQAIFYNRYEDREEFFAKLYEAQDIGCFNGSKQAPRLKSAPKLTAQTFQTAKGKKKALWPVVVAVVLIAAAAVAACFLWPRQEPEPLPEAQDTQASDPEPVKVTNVVLADNDQLKVTALETVLDSRYYTLQLAVENKGSSDLYLTTDQFYLNGMGCPVDWRGNLTAGQTSLVELNWDRQTMETYGITPENVTLVEGDLGGKYLDNSGQISTCPIAYYPFGEENVQLVTFTPGEDDVVLVDTPDFLVVATDSHHDTSGAWVQELVCVNRTGENLLFATQEESLNNHRLLSGLFGMAEWVYAGRTAYCQAEYYDLLWQTTGYEKVLSYGGELSIYNWQSYSDRENQVYPFTVYPEGEAAAQALAPRQLQENEQLYWEDANIRAAYLGAWESNGSNADLFYFQNLTDTRQELEFSLTYWNEEDATGGPVALEPYQEGMYIAYRASDVDGDGWPGTILLTLPDPETGNRIEERPVTIYNPEES